MDIYDTMTDGEKQRARNKARLAELQAESAERQWRMAQVTQLTNLSDQAYYFGAAISCELH